MPSNVSQAHITGLELNASQRFGQTQVAAAATLLNPKDHSGGASEGNLLVRRARQNARIDLDHDHGAWRFGTSVLAVGKRYENAANSVKLGGYATLDLRAEYRLAPAWRIQARIENLLDKSYQTAYGYNQPGVGAFLSLRYQAQ
ncbi:MAG: TonB-dependent receptor [Uliginosibacterium sp.]|nr:TonB-dependent receptor [Uliginosibacterium sp.]